MKKTLFLILFIFNVTGTASAQAHYFPESGPGVTTQTLTKEQSENVTELKNRLLESIKKKGIREIGGKGTSLPYYYEYSDGILEYQKKNGGTQTFYFHADGRTVTYEYEPWDLGGAMQKISYTELVACLKNFRQLLEK